MNDETLPMDINKEEVGSTWGQQYNQIPTQYTVMNSYLANRSHKLVSMVDSETNTYSYLPFALYYPSYKINPNNTKLTSSNWSCMYSRPLCNNNFKVDLSNDDERQKFAEELRSYLRDTSNTTKENVKQTRNEVIAALMKLHSYKKDDHENKSNSLKAVKPKYNYDIDSPSIEAIKNSVEKVDRWLNGQATAIKKVNKLYLGPVTYQKKLKSDGSTTSDMVESEGLKIANFTPTSIASNLLEKYSSQTIEVEKATNIWLKVKKELKIRDERFFRNSKNYESPS